jgi:UPF0042 nucleotide-binding protein
VTTTITSFGYLHADPPPADITLDLRTHFRDPHVNPDLRYLTGRDAAVRNAVLNTPGIRALVEAVVALVRAYETGPTAADITIAVGCAGGRHRAATVAMELGAHLRASVHHRDLDKGVVDR